MRSSSRWLLGSTLLACGQLACVETLHQSGQQVAKGAVEGSAEAARDPEARRALTELMDDPAVQESLSSLSSVIAGGAVDGLTDDARLSRLEAATGRVTAALGAAMADSLDRDVGPAVERLVARSVSRSLSAALGPATAEQMERISAAATRGALVGIEQSTSLDSKGTEMGALARRLSEQATLGFQDAVRTASKENDGEGGDGEVLAAVGETADAALDTAPWIFWGLVLLVLGATGLSVYLITQLRKDHKKTQALSAALSELQDSASAAEVRASVRRALGEA